MLKVIDADRPSIFAANGDFGRPGPASEWPLRRKCLRRNALHLKRRVKTRLAVISGHSYNSRPAARGLWKFR